MHTKDLSVEIHLQPVSGKPNVARITIQNGSADDLASAEIQFLLHEGQKVKGSDTFELLRQDDVYVTGRLPHKAIVPAHGNYAFEIEVTPALTKDKHPKFFYVGFPHGIDVYAPIFARMAWDGDHNAEYGACKVTLRNQSKITLEDPLITFETLEDQKPTSTVGIDTQPGGHKPVSIKGHELTFAEFSGGVEQTRFAPGKEKIFTIGINKGASHKPVALPEHLWVGFEVSVKAILC